MTATAEYVCPFCRLSSDPSGTACSSCGATIDVRRAVSRSGWQEQPPIPDMTRLQFGQSSVQIEGRQVPVADFDMRGQESIYFGHHVFLWKDSSATLANLPLRGGFSRMMAGLPLIMLTAHGPGHVALSDNHAGEIVALPLHPGRPIWVREHRFLCATSDILYDWRPTGIYYQTGTGDDRETHYPLGQFGDVFGAQQQPGLLLLHSPGNTFIRDLGPGETILLQPTALLYSDLSVSMHLHLEYPRYQSPGWHRRYSHRNVWLRLVGPGRVAMSSVFARPDASEVITGSSFRTVHHW